MDGVNNVTAWIQDFDENDIDSVSLTDTGGGLYSGTWDSSGCAGECSYFIDIIADDQILPANISELENINCIN